MTDARDRLAKRMQHLCDLLGLDKAKRQTLLAKKYGVTVTTGRNWLCGLKVPAYEVALQMCEDSGLSYEWLMTGNGLEIRETNDEALLVTDPDLIKLVKLAEPLPKEAKTLAIKGVDSVRQFVEQTQAEYKVPGNKITN